MNMVEQLVLLLEDLIEEIVGDIEDEYDERDKDRSYQRK